MIDCVTLLNDAVTFSQMTVDPLVVPLVHTPAPSAVTVTVELRTLVMVPGPLPNRHVLAPKLKLTPSKYRALPPALQMLTIVPPVAEMDAPVVTSAEVGGTLLVPTHV